MVSRIKEPSRPVQQDRFRPLPVASTQSKELSNKPVTGIQNRILDLLQGLKRDLDTEDLLLIVILVFLYLGSNQEEELFLALLFLLLL